MYLVPYKMYIHVCHKPGDMSRELSCLAPMINDHAVYRWYKIKLLVFIILVNIHYATKDTSSITTFTCLEWSYSDCNCLLKSKDCVYNIHVQYTTHLKC